MFHEIVIFLLGIPAYGAVVHKSGIEYIPTSALTTLLRSFEAGNKNVLRLAFYRIGDCQQNPSAI